MLTDALQQLVREAGGDALLLDARKGRGIVTDTTKLVDLCRRLANGGFSRLVDFCGKHEGGDDFTLYLTLRHPAEHHAALTLRWKYTAPDDRGTVGAEQRSARNDDQGEGPSAAQPLRENGDDSSGNAPAANGEPPAPTYNVNGGAGQPGGQPPRRAGFAAHPSLARVWRAAGLCEREMFELLGIPFAGNDDLSPLFLEDSFYGHPLRTDYELHPAPDYAADMLKLRHDTALLDTPVPDAATAPAGEPAPPGEGGTP